MEQVGVHVLYGALKKIIGYIILVIMEAVVEVVYMQNNAVDMRDARP